MKVRKRLLPAKKRTKMVKDTPKEFRGFLSGAKTGEAQLKLGRPRGISGKKSDHGGIGRLGFRRPGEKHTPAAIRKVPKDTYKRKKK